MDMANQKRGGQAGKKGGSVIDQDVNSSPMQGSKAKKPASKQSKGKSKK
jgi:hypothetical protein